jgi:hypothetical protein
MTFNVVDNVTLREDGLHWTAGCYIAEDCSGHVMRELKICRQINLQQKLLGAEYFFFFFVFSYV